VYRSDWKEIFEPIIERSRVVLANQLALAFGLGKKVQVSYPLLFQQSCQSNYALESLSRRWLWRFSISAELSPQLSQSYIS
jgi:hypothetical protein